MFLYPTMFDPQTGGGMGESTTGRKTFSLSRLRYVMNTALYIYTFEIFQILISGGGGGGGGLVINGLGCSKSQKFIRHRRVGISQSLSSLPCKIMFRKFIYYIYIRFYANF